MVAAEAVVVVVVVVKSKGSFEREIASCFAFIDGKCDGGRCPYSAWQTNWASRQIRQYGLILAQGQRISWWMIEPVKNPEAFGIRDNVPGSRKEFPRIFRSVAGLSSANESCHQNKIVNSNAISYNETQLRKCVPACAITRHFMV